MFGESRAAGRRAASRPAAPPRGAASPRSGKRQRVSSFARDAHDLFERRDAFVDQALAVLAHRLQPAPPSAAARSSLRRRGRGSGCGSRRRHPSARRRRCGPCSRSSRMRGSRPGASGRARRSCDTRGRASARAAARARRSGSTSSRNGSTPMSISRVTALGASLVCTRREHQVAGERRLDRDLRRLVVADLADHDHVGVLAQDRAQRLREGEVDLGVDLHLADARRARTRPGPRR